MSTSLQIKSKTVANKDATKNIAHINENATNAQLKGLAQAIYALSQNTYEDANRITTTDIDESGGGTKTEPTLEVGTFSYDGYYYSAPITYNGDGILGAVATSATAGKNALTFFASGNDTINVSLEYGGGNGFTGYLVASAGASYASKVITIEHQN